MTGRIDIRLLGRVGVDEDGETRAQTIPAMQILLAMLALAPGQPVTRDVLGAELWSATPPPRNPEGTLHTRMTRLRDWLRLPREALTGTGGTYVLRVEPDQVDLVRFHAAADRALAEGPDPATTLAAADEALGLWAGPPWPGIDGPRLDLARDHALRRHQLVVEARVRGLLGVGRAVEAVDAVWPAAQEHPDRESLQALLVTALHDAGRSREGTAAYLSARRHLRDEFGTEPGEELREAFRRLLADRARSSDASTHHRPFLVDRDEPLARIARALDEDAADGRIVCVQGEAGIGKSSLLAAAGHAADAAGATAVYGAWDEGGIPLAAWAEALGAPPADLAGTPAPWVRRRLAELAADGPVLVALDDAHRADSASLGVLTALGRHGVPTGVVVIVSARVPDTVARPDWTATLADLVRHESTVLLTLTELTPAATATLVRSRLTALDDERVDRLVPLVHDRAGGHPLHTAALLDVVGAAPDEPSAMAALAGVPDRLRALFDHQVRSLPPSGRRVLEALAVLRPLPLTDLAAALEDSPHVVADALRPAADLGLVVPAADGFAVRHELLAAAIEGAVPEPARVAWHQARLAVLAPDADAFVRLRHVQAAAGVLPALEVGAAHRDAAVVAYERRALREALALLDVADEALPGDPVVVVHRGLVLGALGRLEEADDLLDRAVGVALDALHGAQGTEGTDGLPSLLVHGAVGDEPLGTTVAGDPRRLARLRRVEPVALPASARFELVIGLLREESLAGIPRPELAEELRALAEGPDADDTVRARAAASAVRQLVEGPEPAARRRALAEDAHQLALRTADQLLVLDSTELLMTAALGAGSIDQACALRDVLEVEARRWHRPRLMWASRLVPAALHLARGDVDAADAAAAEGLRLGQELGVGDAVQAFGVHLMIRHWMAGTADQLADLAVTAATDHPGLPAWAVAAAVARARAGELDDAARWLAAFRARRAATPSRLFDRPALCLAAGAAYTLGDRATAELVRAHLPADPDAVVVLGYGAVITGPAALFAGLAALTLGEHDTARDDLATAEKLATSLGWTPWADAARRLTQAVDGRAGELPLGLGGRRG